MDNAKQKKETGYHHGNLKEALIETALAMICEENIEKLTVRELTRRLGTSRSAIYRHFVSKEELVKAVIRAGFDKLTLALEPVLTEEGVDTLERIHRLGLTYLRFAMENTSLFRILFGEQVMEQREEECDIEDEIETASFHVLVSLVKRGQEEKLLRVEDPILQSAVIWAMVHGLAVLIIDGHLLVRENMEKIYEMSFRTLLEGLKA